MSNLWGEAFEVPNKEKVKKLVKKVEEKKEVSIKRTVKSKKVDLPEKIKLITEEVYRILGVYKDSVEVLYTEEQVTDYINSAVKNGIIAIDTETNHSLDPLTCKLMGPCLYTPGRRQAYVPISHTTLDGELLPNQVSIEFLHNQLERVKNIFCIFHNGKFDYQVIKCTTNTVLPISWDTLIGAKMLDENERAGLKEQYISKIDPSIEKYSIEHLFSDIPYEFIPPEVFALYAATDSFMTFRLYEWQKKKFEDPSLAKLYKLFLETEMPLIPVLAEMELTGMCIDFEYAERLSKKYHDILDRIDEKISEQLSIYEPLIRRFLQSPESKVIRTGSKTIGEQIEFPLKVTSTTQLAILIYDILKYKAVNKQKPRATGEEEIKKLTEEYPEFVLGELILQKRQTEKLINTYIDKLVQCVNPVTKRVHANFNQYGAATGRLSSSDPNMQNIPSHNNEIRMLFCADEGWHIHEVDTEHIVLKEYDSVETSSGIKKARDLSVGDLLIFEDGDMLEISRLENNLSDIIVICAEMKGGEV